MDAHLFITAEQIKNYAKAVGDIWIEAVNTDKNVSPRPDQINPGWIVSLVVKELHNDPAPPHWLKDALSESDDPRRFWIKQNDRQSKKKYEKPPQPKRYRLEGAYLQVSNLDKIGLGQRGEKPITIKRLLCETTLEKVGRFLNLKTE